jgi:alkylation response protein AidB-like acyl-CoA dehydrogenase
VTGGWRLNGQKIWTTNAAALPLHDRAGALVGQPRTGTRAVAVHCRPVIARRDVRPIEDLRVMRHFCEVFFDNVLLGPTTR